LRRSAPSCRHPAIELARRLTATASACIAIVAGGASLAAARVAVPQLEWKDCGTGQQCATAAVPRDYAHPGGHKIRIALIRLPATDPARRIGSLFVNFGGPGAAGVDLVRQIGADLFASLNDRFDIVGFDPRGVGESTPAVDCHADQETEGVYFQPFPRPGVDPTALATHDEAYIRKCLDANRGILPYLTTANTARDLDLLRAAVGDERLSYLGFSYGTFLGATYASLFPRHMRALVLDGAIDPDRYINHPLDDLRDQTAGLERALDRFLAACAAQQDVCQFGGSDPRAALDALLAKADTAPLPATGDDPRPVDGDDLRTAIISDLYAKQLWPEIAQLLHDAAAGDGTLARQVADYEYGRQPDGSYSPDTDRYFLLSASEQRYPDDVQPFIEAGNAAFSSFPHFWFNNGYVELNWGLYPVRGRSVFRGPFHVPDDAPPVLVVGTTFDPATPYDGAVALVQQLGDARLLTMDGDGHTAYGGNSPCIDGAVDAYLEDGTLPAPGTVCQQDVPFAAPTKRSLVVDRRRLRPRR
jgi:pimeloyl-ACP methyl ester carboxylesterase